MLQSEADQAIQESNDRISNTPTPTPNGVVTSEVTWGDVLKSPDLPKALGGFLFFIVLPIVLISKIPASNITIQKMDCRQDAIARAGGNAFTLSLHPVQYEEYKNCDRLPTK